MSNIETGDYEKKINETEEFKPWSGYTREEAQTMVGAGWRGLVDECYDLLTEDCYVADVKEKWGELRFYYYGGSNELFDKIEAICDRSNRVCEICGEPGKLKIKELGWIKTLCDKHYEERQIK
jgi:hypothetical protein